MILFYKMAELENQQIQKRQVAYKVRIKDILNGSYIKEDGWLPNYIEVNGKKISRVNLISTVVLKVNENNIVLDDGSGKITVRVFENNGFFNKIDIGGVTLLIGRPREFSSEKYILPEVLKKIENPLWIDVRKLELRLNNENLINLEENKKDNIAQEDIVEEVEEPNEKIFNLIKELDKGEGADIMEILKKDNNFEKIINKLLENGEIFEIKPGKVKVLE